MRLFVNYLKSEKRVFLCFASFAVIFLTAFFLYRLPLAAVLYPAALCLLMGCVYLAVGFLRFRKKHDCLARIQKMTAEMIDTLPEPDDSVEQAYQDIVRMLLNEAVQQSTGFSAKYRDMTEYYTLWAHQIKTPIASMKLTLQNEDSPLSRRLRSELFRIEQYVEMVLAFLRLDSASTDYVFREYALDDIIRQSVRKYAPDFITKKIRLDYQTIGDTLITDEKWLCFVLDQILSNALKYTKTGSIHIFMESPKTLCIADTGIGIAPEDLPRIFEKGYTGCNGRTDKSASGIGLYLCRRICDKLGIGITAQSEPGKGTVLRLRMEQHLTRM